MSGTDIPVGFATDIYDIVKTKKSYFAIVEQTEQMTIHTQFVHLTRAHAKQMSTFTEWGRILPKDSTEECPDEYIPYSIAKFQDWHTDIENDQLTDMERAYEGAPSPISFCSWNGKYHLYSDVEKEHKQLKDNGKPVTKSLVGILKDYISTEQSYIFFRKVTNGIEGKQKPKNKVILSTFPWLF